MHGHEATWRLAVILGKTTCTSMSKEVAKLLISSSPLARICREGSSSQPEEDTYVRAVWRVWLSFSATYISEGEARYMPHVIDCSTQPPTWMKSTA